MIFNGHAHILYRNIILARIRVSHSDKIRGKVHPESVID
jgi:hypothetical protein